MIESLARNVEKEKMKAIGASNVVSSMSKAREAEQTQYQVISCTTDSTLLISLICKFLISYSMKSENYIPLR